MKKIFFFCILHLFAGIILLFSCKKEYSCENCKENKPPIANAGTDQTISLPKDSMLLDGSASTDPDGTITSHKWAKIVGPVSSNILKPDSSRTLVKTLVPGIYQFELTVKDNGGLSAKDTVRVMVDVQGNQPPIACAGADQTISLPANTVHLNGSCSADPDNNINSYAWTKITGPASFNMANPNVVQTQVLNLVQGVYQFELKVTDAGGLFSKDTMQVTVNAAVVTYICGDTNRLRINATLTQVGTLSIPRVYMAVASVGDKILFAGGINTYPFSQSYSSRVDIYNVSTNTWSTAELNVARFSMGTVTAGNRVFFAGGDNSDGAYPLPNVDVYDASTNSWSRMNLDFGNRNQGIAAAAVGNKVLFAGGEYPTPYVQIFDLTTNTWSEDTLNTNMEAATAVTANNKVYFGGGSCNKGIIIYDNNTNTWSTRALNESRDHVAGVSVGNKIYWAGGSFYCNTSQSNICSVEIHDLNSGNISMHNLSGPKAFWPVNGQNAVMKGNKIIFYKSNITSISDPFSAGKFDIYDITTGTWSIGVLPFLLEDASIISVNNTVYMAGGVVNGVLSNKVWKLDF